MSAGRVQSAEREAVHRGTIFGRYPVGVEHPLHAETSTVSGDGASETKSVRRRLVFECFSTHTAEVQLVLPMSAVSDPRAVEVAVLRMLYRPLLQRSSGKVPPTSMTATATAAIREERGPPLHSGSPVVEGHRGGGRGGDDQITNRLGCLPGGSLTIVSVQSDCCESAVSETRSGAAGEVPVVVDIISVLPMSDTVQHVVGKAQFSVTCLVKVRAALLSGCTGLMFAATPVDFPFPGHVRVKLRISTDESSSSEAVVVLAKYAADEPIVLHKLCVAAVELNHLWCSAIRTPKPASGSWTRTVGEQRYSLEMKFTPTTPPPTTVDAPAHSGDIGNSNAVGVDAQQVTQLRRKRERR